MWDPTNDKFFERYNPRDSMTSSDYIRALSDDDLELAVDQWIVFEKRGKWPIDDTIVNRIWEKCKSELGDDPHRGRIQAYCFICREIAERWYKSR